MYFLRLWPPEDKTTKGENTFPCYLCLIQNSGFCGPTFWFSTEGEFSLDISSKGQWVRNTFVYRSKETRKFMLKPVSWVFQANAVHPSYTSLGFKNIFHIYHLIKLLSGSILNILLHMNKPRLREVKWLVQGHTEIDGLNSEYRSLRLKSLLFLMYFTVFCASCQLVFFVFCLVLQDP